MGARSAICAPRVQHLRGGAHAPSSRNSHSHLTARAHVLQLRSARLPHLPRERLPDPLPLPLRGPRGVVRGRRLRRRQHDDADVVRRDRELVVTCPSIVPRSSNHCGRWRRAPSPCPRQLHRPTRRSARRRWRSRSPARCSCRFHITAATRPPQSGPDAKLAQTWHAVGSGGRSSRGSDQPATPSVSWLIAMSSALLRIASVSALILVTSVEMSSGAHTRN